MRRIQLLCLFWEKLNKPCGNCDNCENPPLTRDATKDAQKLLSCIYRCSKTNGLGFGASHVIKVLRGEVSDKIFEKRHDELSTFGIGRDHTMKYWRRILRQLIAKHYVNVNYRVYNVLTVSDEPERFCTDRKSSWFGWKATSSFRLEKSSITMIWMMLNKDYSVSFASGAKRVPIKMR